VIYSLLKLLTGLTIAAFAAWTLTVNIEMAKVSNLATAKYFQLKSTL